MITHVQRMFSMRRDEVGPASLLFFYLFLIIGAYMMGQAAGNALFLKVFPRHLPYAMIASALTIGAFVSAYIRLSNRLRLEPLINATLLFFALCFVGFWWLTHFKAPWVYLLVYVWVYAMGAMGPMMGWTLANYVLTTREARRVFAFIGAGGILGGTFMSFFTADVLGRGYVRPQALFLAIAFILMVCALLVRVLFRSTRQRLAAVSLAPTASHMTPKNFGQSFNVIRSSRYLLLVTALIAVGCLTTSIMTYQFLLIANSAYAGPPVRLAAFFARFFGYMGLASLVVQLALTGPLLRAFGIRVTLFVLPLALMGGTLGVLIAPTLLTVGLLRGSHYTLRYSLDKSSTELLYLPVSPEVKSQVKSFIDTFVWRSADGIAGATLLLFANVLKFSPSQVGLVNLVFLVGWITIAYGARREYLNVLRLAIQRRTLDPERTATSVLDSTTTEVLAQAVERGGEQQLLYGLSLFEMGGEPRFHPVLRRLLDHPSPAVRQRALRLLDDAGDLGIVTQAEKLLADESLEVRAEALHYLVVHAGRDPLTLLSAERDFPDYGLQGAVVGFLARTAKPEHLAAAELILQDMLARAGPDAAHSRADAARALGVISPPCGLHSELFKLLRDDDFEVLEQALLSAGKIQGSEFLPQVIEKLGEPRLRGTARAALVQYGPQALHTLRDYLNDAAVPLAIRKQIPKVLARIPSSDSAAALAESLIQSDPGMRFDVLKALNKLRSRDPGLVPPRADVEDMLNAELLGYYRSFQILAAIDPNAGIAIPALSSGGGEPVLTRALRERMAYELERIFRLLALLYPPRDIHNAFLGLTMGTSQRQANALEVLENLLQPDLYRRLVNGLDAEIPLREKVNFACRLCGSSVKSRNEALRILLHSKDGWLSACALYAVGEERLTDLNDEVSQVPHAADPLLDETWQWASARLKAAMAA
jgi:AAA family ATP:ADP antiporter